MIIAKLFLAYFSAWLVGYLVLRIIDRRGEIPWGFKFFAAFFVGVGIFTLEVFTAGILGAGLDWKLFLGIIFADLTILGLLNYLFPSPGVGRVRERSNQSTKRKLIVSIILLLLLLKILASLWQTTHIPTFEFDAWNNWNMRPKVIFTQAKIPLDPKSEFYLGGGIKSYPLNDGLWKVFLANLAGSWRENVVNTASVFYYAILLGLFYFALPQKWGRLEKLGATYLLASLPFLYFHSWIPYADLEFAGYLFFTLVAFYKFLGEKKRAWLPLSALALALAIWTKNEGFAVVLPIIFIIFPIANFFSAEKKLAMASLLKYWLIVAIVSAPWLVFRFLNHLDVLSGDSSTFHLVYNSQFFKEAFYSIFLRSHFNFLWLLVFLLIIFQVKKIWRDSPLRFLTLTLLALFAFYNGIIIFTDKAYDLSALVRVNLQIAPVALFLVTLILGKFFRSLSASDQGRTG